jgi:hypothetical protein
MSKTMFKHYLLLLVMLIPLVAFAQKSRAYSPVLVLNQLHAFHQQHGYEGFDPGFGLTTFDDDSALAAGWSRDPQFLSALYPFARANGSRAFYAIWQMNPRDNLSRSPVIYFGDDGSEYVVAQNARELISLVMLDTESDAESDGDFSAFTRSNTGYSTSHAHSSFSAWLQQSAPRVQSDLDGDNEIIIKRAQRKYEPAFKKWKKKYVKRKR